MISGRIMSLKRGTTETFDVGVLAMTIFEAIALGYVAGSIVTMVLFFLEDRNKP